MRKPGLLWAVNPIQGLAESVLVGLPILAVTAYVEGRVTQSLYQMAIFFLCGACGLWAVLRIRLPRFGGMRQTVWEATVGAGVSIAIAGGLRLLGGVLGVDSLWRLSRWDPWSINLMLIGTGAGYFLARGGVRLWLGWDRLRRRHLRWSLIHAHLMVVVLIAFLAAVGGFAVASRTAVHIWPETTDPLALFASGVLVTFFPALMVILALTIAALVIIFPPVMAFSFFVARPTTRRVEALAAATAALRAGDFSARVPVDGEDEIGSLQADFNTMADRLEIALAELESERDTVAQGLEERRALVASVSHELRTPVATLRAAVETTVDRWETAPADETRRRLDVMSHEIERLSGLIDDLFTLSRAEVGQLALDCKPLGLGPLIEQTVSAFAPLAWAGGRVEVAASLPETLAPVRADAGRLQQVLLNLLRNAAGHTPPGGIVAIVAEDEAHMVRVEVRDTGEGIDAADLPHIWDRFYRGKNAGFENAGLGLALVRELVEAMGGSVSVESEAGQGSCFALRLVRVGKSG